MRSIALVVPSLGFVLLTGCAHAPVGAQDPNKLLGYACDPGSKTESVKGTVVMRAHSKDASGQFPALVNAKSPATLTIEVTNLVGSTQALIQIEGKRYTITAPDPRTKQMRKHQEGVDAWGGIPLRWATELFLGRVPCPGKDQLTGAHLGLDEHDGLVVETPAGLEQDKERFIYRFRTWGGAPWPEALHWERFGTSAAVVDFKFDQPDDRSHSPGKWEAKSALGEVKVRWRDREILPPG